MDTGVQVKEATIRETVTMLCERLLAASVNLNGMELSAFGPSPCNQGDEPKASPTSLQDDIRTCMILARDICDKAATIAKRLG